MIISKYFTADPENQPNHGADGEDGTRQLTPEEPPYTIPIPDRNVTAAGKAAEYNISSMDLQYWFMQTTPEFLRNASYDELHTTRNMANTDFGLFEADSRRLEVSIISGNSGFDDALTMIRQHRRELKQKFSKLITQIEHIMRVNEVEMEAQKTAKQPTASATGTAQPVIVHVPMDPAKVVNTWGTFDGNPLKWHAFISAFKTTVHDNNDIPAVNKFKHLQTALKGTAETAIGSWDITAENYQHAWTRLMEVFDKKYPRVRAHIEQITNLPALRYTNSAGLLKLSHTTYENVRQLNALGLPTEHWDMWLVCILHSKLDPSSGCEWELARDNNDGPTLDSMLRFIERRAGAYSGLPTASTSGTTQHQTATMTNQPAKPSSTQTANTPATTDNDKKKHFCVPCKQQHQVYACPRFLALTLNERKQYVERWHLCPNCLRNGHTAANCFSQPCRRCPGAQAHNQLLCPMRQLANPTVSVNTASSSGASGKK